MTVATSLARLWTAQRSEELAHLVGERLRLLQRGEMAAARHCGPAPDIGVGPFRQRARRTQDLGREVGISHRDVDGAPIGDRPWPMPDVVIWPKGRADRAGKPIEADICKKPVAGKCSFDIAATIRPGAE